MQENHEFVSIKTNKLSSKVWMHQAGGLQVFKKPHHMDNNLEESLHMKKRWLMCVKNM